MGSNVSVDKSSEEAPMKSRFSFRLKSSNKSSISTPIKENSFNGKNPIAQFSFKPESSVQDVGSKEESFFDTQAWLESDCEEDFVSVNGDFTPSRGSTNHRSSFTVSPRLSNTDRAPNLKTDESSSTDKKKKLSELLQDSFEDNPLHNDPKIANGEVDFKPANLGLPPKSSSNGTSYLFKSNSVCSNGKLTPNNNSKSQKAKSSSATKCCMPSLVVSLSSSERKKRLSPGNNFIE